MSTSISYTRVRETLAEVLDRVENDQEEVIITRKGHEDVALVSAAELASLRETAHLLRSPANAARLLRAMERSRQGEPGEERDIEELAGSLDLSLPKRSKSRR